jgi:hypothetical protein
MEGVWFLAAQQRIGASCIRHMQKMNKEWQKYSFFFTASFSILSISEPTILAEHDDVS